MTRIYMAVARSGSLWASDCRHVHVLGADNSRFGQLYCVLKQTAFEIHFLWALEGSWVTFDLVLVLRRRSLMGPSGFLRTSDICPGNEINIQTSIPVHALFPYYFWEKCLIWPPCNFLVNVNHSNFNLDLCMFVLYYGSSRK